MVPGLEIWEWLLPWLPTWHGREEGTLTETLPPSDGAIGQPVGHIQDCWLMYPDPSLHGSVRPVHVGLGCTRQKRLNKCGVRESVPVSSTFLGPLPPGQAPAWSPSLTSPNTGLCGVKVQVRYALSSYTWVMASVLPQQPKAKWNRRVGSNESSAPWLWAENPVCVSEIIKQHRLH